MPYLLLVVEPRDQRATRSPEEGRAVYQRMLDYAGELQSRGVLRAANSLRRDADGVRVQVREGRRMLKDGPFTESKEMVGGFFLVDCETREDAISLAAQCPAAEWSTIEVREVGPCFDR